MTSPELTLPPRSSASPGPMRALAARAWSGDAALVIYAVVLLGAALLFAVGWALDERVLRGANVWIKPFKFATSIALLALTTACFASFIDAAHRPARALRWIRVALIVSGSFEISYIALQAALGEASHFNVGDPLHATMYSLMGVGAIVLTATQPALAWQLHRHAAPGLDPTLRSAIVIGLVLTFVLGAGAGMPMSALPAVSNAGGLPFVGWSLQGGDLRPAHFIGIHAGQVIPAVGAWLSWRRPGSLWGSTQVRAFAAAWTALFAAAILLAFVPVPLLTY
jgi:hypothetical protein